MASAQTLPLRGELEGASSHNGELEGALFLNPSLSAEERASDLCSRLTLEEKAQLMMDISKPIDRLGVPQFIWWSEALHGVGRNGFCTVFPSCIGMAASFDDILLEKIYTAISDEARAKNTAQRKIGKLGRYQGLSFWTPNINIFRDPRWGRGQETYGEDPYMNSRMGLAVVRGLQGPADSKYYKLFACAKHFAVHSGPEKTRHFFDIENLSPRDLWETYLPAFKSLVTQGDVKEVMCAYQRFEGQPCCGNNRLLQQILRDEWGFNGIVVSDCGAISDFYVEDRHGVSKDAADASAKAVISGTDVECGSNYTSLPDAVKAGAITEEQIDVSVKRLLQGRFELGDFDPDELVPWTKIPESVIASKEHRELALQMAREQLVLLKNDGILPLNKDDENIVIMGPNAADSIMLWGIYYGQPTHSVTVLEGITNKLGNNVNYIKGCDITTMTESESLFSKLTDADGNPGMSGSFWNNAKMEGVPIYQGNYTSPLKFDNGGNTVFAPGVNLTDFTASFKGSFIADCSEQLDIIYSNDDGFRLIINGDTIDNRWRSQELKLNKKKYKVKEGMRYIVQLDYMQLADGATLSFDITRKRDVSIDEILDRTKDFTTVVFVGGISPELEREEAKISEPGFDNGDRTSIELPQVQRELLAALHDAGKKIILVNCSGSAVALTPETETCDAILQAWYPGEQGGNAVADVLFGDYNPSGKLPVTFYKDDSQLPPFDDYSMANRTYRYFKGDALFPFGYGLSYTTLNIGEPVYDTDNETVTVDVTNTGNREGTEIIQVYLRNPSDADGPIKTLRGFARVELKAGEIKTATIAFPKSSFECWDAESNTMRVMPGQYQLLVGTSSLASDLKTINVTL
ncbi:MAG: glycoside hydrolase family 3 C-terminal domain-containing protein [Prevotella sp.]|nr:glycoside hydrolase family 3 C-terminal domain-containing protein [Prevotella sp.]